MMQKTAVYTVKDDLLHYKNSLFADTMTMPKNTLHQKSLLTGKLYTWSCLFLKDFTYSKWPP